MVAGGATTGSIRIILIDLWCGVRSSTTGYLLVVPSGTGKGP
jgi:hypothetical protein